MNKALIFCGLLVAGLYTGSATAGDPAAGEAMTTVCAACHGPDGNSAVPNFPKLAGLGEKYLLKQLTDIRDGRRPIASMVGQVDNMSDEQLADIAAYYAAQTRTSEQANPDMIKLGEQIYRGGISDRGVPACAACHSPNGKGNGPAGFPPLAGQYADYIASSLRAYRQGYEDPAGRTNDGDTMIMRATAFKLSDMEIDAVSSYASGLQ